jgi:hypothetical protein
MQKFTGLGLAALAIVVMPIPLAQAHAPIISCFDNGDDTVTCEAGYSDGASSKGQTVRVLLDDQRLVVESKFDDDGTFTFDKPEAGFYVEFEGDPSHLATFYGEDL